MVDRSEYIIDQTIAEGMETLLADVIRKYPILYDKTHKQRSQSIYPEKHDAAWNKISDELNLELESCKSLWSCMKQKFIKHRKRLDNGESVSSWPTYEVLHKWLDKHVKKRRTRHDYIKQMKVLQQSTPAKSRARSVSTATITTPLEDNDDDDINGPDEEWTEIMEDKNTMVKIQLKRKLDDSDVLSDQCISLSPTRSGGQLEPKKKFKIEVFSEHGTEIFNDRDSFSDGDTESANKDTNIVVLKKGTTVPASQIEVIELNESAGLKSNNEKRSNECIDANFGKLEHFLTNCVRLIERCTVEKPPCDSNEVFGKYIASMVHELPAEKRMKVRLNILQYTSELIANETKI